MQCLQSSIESTPLDASNIEYMPELKEEARWKRRRSCFHIVKGNLHGSGSMRQQDKDLTLEGEDGGGGFKGGGGGWKA